MFKRILLLVSLIAMLLFRESSPSPAQADFKPVRGNTASQKSPAELSYVFLPLILTPPPLVPMLIGVYSPAYMGQQGNIDLYLKGLDSWTGLSRTSNQGHALAGDFLDFEDAYPDYNIPVPAELLWTNGYTKFINIMSSRSAAFIAGGSLDNAILRWANAYKNWVSQGGKRKAFLAPLPEMNGNWVIYGMDPTNFKLAYQRILNIFAQAGVTRDQVWWVFAPNGWSTPPYHIADYYPGDANVDIVAFSSYNQSYAVPWMEPVQVFGPYLQEIRTTVTTAKPIFIAQTATCSNNGNKDQWIRDAYTYLVQQNIRAVLYFNRDNECDWAVYIPGGRQVQGYKDAVAGPNTRYIAPAVLSGTILPP
jgi:hypothetical protein